MKLLRPLLTVAVGLVFFAFGLACEIADATRENRLKRKLGRHYEGPAADDL